MTQPALINHSKTCIYLNTRQNIEHREGQKFNLLDFDLVLTNKAGFTRETKNTKPKPGNQKPIGFDRNKKQKPNFWFWICSHMKHLVSSKTKENTSKLMTIQAPIIYSVPFKSRAFVEPFLF